MLKALLFDLDDTLIDWREMHISEDWAAIESNHLEKVYAYLQTIGEPSVGLEKFKAIYGDHSTAAWRYGSESLIAPHIGQVLYESAQSAGIPKDALTIEGCENAYQMSAFNGVELFPDVLDALELFRKHGLQMGIITNAYHTMRMRDVEIAEHGIFEYFPKCRLSAADAGYLKPHPAIFEKALDCLGIYANEAVFIGDNPIADVSGAQGVGMKAVLRNNGNRRPVHSVVADATITSLLELPAVLDRWYPGWSAE